MDKTISEIFNENQAKLPEEKRCARGKCCSVINNDGYSCTLLKGHKGVHVAHGILGDIITEGE
jgi:hypothetical protein